MRWGWILIVAASVLAGCGGPTAPSALPTLTLVPPTETALPTDIPNPPTEDPELTSPESLLTAAAPTPSGSLEDASDDPIAAELVLLAQQQVAEELGVSIRRVRLVSIEARQWEDSSLGCPQPDAAYIPIEVDGYRIEVRAAEATYVFHTDFDRVILCQFETESG